MALNMTQLGFISWFIYAVRWGKALSVNAWTYVSKSSILFSNLYKFFEFIVLNDYNESIDFEWEALVNNFAFQSSCVLRILPKSTLAFWIEIQKDFDLSQRSGGLFPALRFRFLKWSDL